MTVHFGAVHDVLQSMNPDMRRYANTQEDWKRDFDLVLAGQANKSQDWRGPIAALVEIVDLERVGTTIENVAEAIMAMTATEAKVEPVKTFGTEIVSAYWITAKGYRAGPAGP